MEFAVKSMVAGLALALGAGSPAWAGDPLSFEQAWVAPTAGTLGPGIEGGVRWNEYWGARASVNAFSLGFTYHQKKYDLDDRMRLLNAGLTADYYPFGGDFYVSGGVRIAANRIEGRMFNLKDRKKNGSINIIDDPLTKFTVSQNTFQPYLGAGYSIQLEERVTLNFDFGALYAGTPQLSVNSHADRFGISRREINNAIDRARDRIAPFKVYPVAQIGLRFNF